MPKWTIFAISFVWKHQSSYFHYWNYLRNFWRNNWPSIIDVIFRKAWILPHCLSPTSNVETLEFDAALFNGGIIVPDKILPSDFGNWRKKGEKRWGKTITVQCFPLQSVLVALNNPIVDYFSLDVEGSELPILKSLDWDNVNISVISGGLHVLYVWTVGSWVTWFISSWERNNCLLSWANSQNDNYFHSK